MLSYRRNKTTGDKNVIIGQGVDIVEIARVSGAIDRGGEAFLHRVYTPAEIVEAGNRKNASMAYYAGRWAAKEAEMPV